VKAIITQNAFGDNNSSFFTSLEFNPLITKRTKAEFLKNADWAINELKTLQ
jgi:hypothetical protein